MKKVHLKSAIPIYIAAAVWLVMGLIFPKLLMKLPGLIAAVALSVAGYFVGSKVFPGRDITVEEKIQTGDAKLDQDIAEGRARLEKLREANAAIEHPGITASLNRMTKAGEQIFKELGRDPKKITLVRRFMSYYLPTSEKLMDQYRELDATAVKGENIQEPGVPESFKVLIREMQSLCLNVEVLGADGRPVSLRDSDEDAYDAVEELGINISKQFESGPTDEI